MKNYKTYLGIDPGKTGGLALIGSGKQSNANPKVTKMPMLTNRDYDIKTIKRFVKKADVVCIEVTHTMPQMGKKAAYTFGWGAGMLYTVAFILQKPIVMVRAATWRKTVLLGTHGTDNKQRELEAMIRMWPGIDFGAMTKAGREGVAAALCLAVYARGLDGAMTKTGREGVAAAIAVMRLDNNNE